MKKGFIYNKEIGGSHKSAAVYVEILEQHELQEILSNYCNSRMQYEMRKL